MRTSVPTVLREAASFQPKSSVDLCESVAKGYKSA